MWKGVQTLPSNITQQMMRSLTQNLKHKMSESAYCWRFIKGKAFSPVIRNWLPRHAKKFGEYWASPEVGRKTFFETPCTSWNLFTLLLQGVQELGFLCSPTLWVSLATRNFFATRVYEWNSCQKSSLGTEGPEGSSFAARLHRWKKSVRGWKMRRRNQLLCKRLFWAAQLLGSCRS